MNTLIFKQLYRFSLALLICFIPIKTDASDVSSSVLVKVHPVQEKSIGEQIIGYGVLEPDPDQLLSISLPHAGLINRVWVRMGQRVKSGDKLLEVITSPESHMQYLQAQANVEFARRELQRYERLLSEQLATRAQVDAAKKNLADAQTTLRAQKQRGLNLKNETIRAPMDGIISQIPITQGQRIQSDSTAMLIAAERHLVARVGIEPEDLSRIHPGLSVNIRSVFVPDIQVLSQIREIHAMINPSTNLVEILAPIPDKNVDHLVLGSRITATIQLPEHTGMVVPRSAILGTPDNQYIYTVINGSAKRIQVKMGISAKNYVEIRATDGGIKVGDTVVIEGNYELSDGMSVRESH